MSQAGQRGFWFACALLVALASHGAAPRAACAQDELGSEFEGDAAEEPLTAEPTDSGERPDQAPHKAESDPPPAEAEGIASDGSLAPAATEESSLEAAAPVTPVAQEGRAIALRMSAAFGVGSLSFTRPTLQGAQRVAESPYAASELALRVQAWPRDAFSLETLLTYQTSIGLSIELPVLFGLPERIAARVQRVELSVAPVLRLRGAPSSVSLAFPIGFAYRTFVTEEHQYQLPRWSLGGPLLRAELTMHLGELVRVRGGPEMQWIVLISPSLSDDGACCQGLAVAGQAALEADLGAHLRVALAYREARSSIPLSALYKDVERLLVARITGEL